MEKTESDAAPGLFYGYFVVLASFFIVLVTWGTFFSFGVFLEPLVKTFGWNRAEISGSYALATLTAGFFSIVMGRLNDTCGPKAVLSLCGLIAGTGYLLAALTTSLWQLYMFYGFIVGVGVGGFFVPTTSTIARWFVKKRTLMTGIVLMGISVGTMIIPRLAAGLIAACGWRATLAMLGVGNLLVVLTLAQLLKRCPEECGTTPHGVTGGNNGEPSLQASGHALSEALHMKQFWLLCGIYFCFYFSINSVVAHIVAHAAGSGIPLEKAAGSMVALGAGGIAGRVVIGLLGDRIGNRLTCLICLAVLCLAVLALVKVTGLVSLAIVCIAIGLCFAGGGALMAPLMADYFGLKAHGLLLGIVYASDMVGGAIGPVLAGAIFDATSSYDMAFLIASAVAFVGCLLLALLA